MASVEQLIDHAAELQQEVDRIWSELLLCYLMIFALAVLTGFVTLYAWRAGR